MKQYDILIIGQGIAGSLLGYALDKVGKRVMIIDDGSTFNASRVAAGLYNPITGRNMSKTWMSDELFPLIAPFYDQLEKELNIKFHYSLPMYRPFHGTSEINDWQVRGYLPSYTDFITSVADRPMGIENLKDTYGGLQVKQTGFVDIKTLLDGFKKYFSNKHMLLEEKFNPDQMQIQIGIEYKGIYADKIIFCDGPAVVQNKFWSHLKFKPVKGEILDIKCNLPQNLIINRGVFIIPRGGYFRVGSTYDHQELSWEPTTKGREYLENKFRMNFAGKYEVIGHYAGVRPATFDRKPYIGFHPERKNVGIFNGFGTKGVSLIPYFSKLMVEYLLQQQRLPEEISVLR